MTDRELLELAAKAAGIEYRPDSGYRVTGVGVTGMPHLERWNSLADDGDAFRLAVKLDIDTLGDGKLHDGQPCMSVVYPISGDYDCASEIVRAGDEYAAMRRAITRAAAAIQLAKESS